MLGGEIDAGIPAYIPQVHSAKSIAVTSGERVDFLPGVPTARESGVADVASGTFTALAAPAGTPPEIVIEDEPDPRRVPQDRRGEKAVRDARRAHRSAARPSA